MKRKGSFRRKSSVRKKRSKNVTPLQSIGTEPTDISGPKNA
ncbi:hypothetical protein TNCT_23831, partial [Trichonephila clavata]